MSKIHGRWALQEIIDAMPSSKLDAPEQKENNKKLMKELRKEAGAEQSTSEQLRGICARLDAIENRLDALERTDKGPEIDVHHAMTE
jgi:hypothetical protein